MVDEDRADSGSVIILEDEGNPQPAPASADGVVVIADDGSAEDPLPERAILMDGGSIVLPLLHPVTLRFKKRSEETVREEKHERFHFRRLRGPDMRAIAAVQGTAGFQATLLARSAQIPEGKFNPIYDQMDGEDIVDATIVVGRFLASGRRTGR